MKKIIITTILAFIVSASMAQSKKPRTAIIKKSITVDSMVYLPDTIPVLFKELIVGKQIIEKWQMGFVIFQTNVPYPPAISSGEIIWSGDNRVTFARSKPYYTREISYTDIRNEKYLYSDYTPVKNRILTVLKP